MNNAMKIGVAGLGAIGRSHIDRIANKLRGAHVVATTDVAAEHGKKVAESLNLPFYADENALLAKGGVDAMIVTAADAFHERYVMAAVKAGIPVLCEKPLAPDAAGCKRVIDAEMAGGKKLVQVGFMRRYDPGYRQLKKLLDSGKFGAPLMLHCAHRNYEVPDDYDTPMAISNSLIHEIDVLRWLVGEDYESVEVSLPRTTKYANGNLRDPQILILHSVSGIRMDVEIFVNCRVGYDIQCEICCEEGFLKLPDLSAPSMLVNASRVAPICRDWSERFIAAYDTELQEWINASREGRVDGPTAWDGYAACIAADFAHQARDTRSRVKIEIPGRPEFYA